MNILFIYRCKDSGPSIRRVFEPIEKELQNNNSIDSIYLPINTASLIDIYRNIKYVKDCIRERQYDVIHITGEVHYLIYFLRNYNIVVTVHDLGFYIHNNSFIKKKLLYLFFIYPIKFSKSITFISESSQNEANRLINISNIHQYVIYNPISPTFSFFPKEINQEKPTILHIGTKANKNLSRVIEAVSTIPCHLHIIGDVSTELMSRISKLKINVCIEKNVSDNDIIESYKQCDVVCFPSLYEGFGMPIIEGQAIGRPIVTSNRSPMNILAGKGAILVDPESVVSIREGIINALCRANELIDYGVDNVKRFTVKEISRQYQNVYNQTI